VHGKGGVESNAASGARAPIYVVPVKANGSEAMRMVARKGLDGQLHLLVAGAMAVGLKTGTRSVAPKNQMKILCPVALSQAAAEAKKRIWLCKALN
jgi:hypothetical protein